MNTPHYGYIMEALNKKIPSEQLLIEFFSDVGLIQIILTAAIYPILLMADTQLLPVEAFSAFSAAMILLFSSRYLVPAFVITLFTAIYVTGITGILAIITISACFYALYRFFTRKSQSLSLLITANLAHFGDAVTTYIGLKRGLSESNIFLNRLIGLYGDWTIFLIKSMVIPLTVYPYFRFSGETRTIYLKAVLGIGLYLVFRNTMFILEA